MSKVIDGIKKDLAAIPKMAKEKMHRSDLKKQVLLNLPYLMVGIFAISQHGCGGYQPERMLQKK